MAKLIEGSPAESTWLEAWSRPGFGIAAENATNLTQ
jgi:hypothetical protein